MTTASLSARPAKGNALWQRLQRERALIALFNPDRQKTFVLRSARLYAFGVFVSYAIAIGLAHGSEQRTLIHEFLYAALIALSWTVGALSALGTAQALSRQGEGGVLAFAEQRGFSHRAVLRARALAAATRIARLLGLPALALIVVGVLRGATLAWAVMVTPAVLLYACALGSVLALFAYFAAALAPRHARALLAALLLGPLLLAQAYPALPSIPSLFSWLLSALLRAGAPPS